MDPLTTRTAADVCRLFKLKEPARALLRPDHSPQHFYELLRDGGHLADARRLLAHVLPPHRAVWWAALCLQHSAARKPLPDVQRVAFHAAARWCAEPSEATRRAAGTAGWAAKPSTAGGTLAMAAFLSGGSMSRPGLPAVTPEPHLCGRLSGVVVYLASVRFDPARYKAHLRAYLAVGEDVAAGRLLPPTATSPVTEPAAAPPADDLAARYAAFLAQMGPPA